MVTYFKAVIKGQHSNRNKHDKGNNWQGQITGCLNWKRTVHLDLQKYVGVILFAVNLWVVHTCLCDLNAAERVWTKLRYGLVIRIGNIFQNTLDFGQITELHNKRLIVVKPTVNKKNPNQLYIAERSPTRVQESVSWSRST